MDGEKEETHIDSTTEKDRLEKNEVNLSIALINALEQHRHMSTPAMYDGERDPPGTPTGATVSHDSWRRKQPMSLGSVIGSRTERCFVYGS